ncbi:hypothetical protein DHEL01_v209870 [Diaporthe helianthi]|uniref:Uncharacterized protein n=1 Tax=Diaporthe helianthi TaxID=158607 RepID=A0A2P5HNC4_DIAHE|nr:hypothetical protein DHEL01_v209870 [Diaporthe helianthi]
MGKASNLSLTSTKYPICFNNPHISFIEPREVTMTASTSNHALSLHTLLLLLATVSHLFSLVTADCYWPDGSNAFDMQECYGSEGADGLCCAPGDSCLMNQLCRNEIDNSFYRGACNMQNWTEGMTCPKFCNSLEDENNVAGIQIVDECPELSDGYFVCHKGATGRNTCFDPFNTILKLDGGSAGFTLSKIGAALTIAGCNEEYNVAGNPTPLADMPSCPYGNRNPWPETASADPTSNA